MFQPLIFGVLSLLLLLESWALASASTTIPPEVQGYYSDTKLSKWVPTGCRGNQVYVSTTIDSKKVGRCCADININCDFVTTCFGKTAWVTGGHHSHYYTCSKSGDACIGLAIHASLSDDSPFMDYYCGPVRNDGLKVYRITTTSAETTTSTTAAPGTTATSSIASPTATDTDAAESTTQDSGNSGSKAWIAGAVIGPIAGCAIVAGVAFWLVRRSRANDQAAGNSGGMVAVNELHGASSPSEMGSRPSKSEAPGDMYPRQELPAY